MSSSRKGLAVGLWLLALLCATVWAELDSALDEPWELWKTTHQKNYTNEVEELGRRALWEKNLMKINTHNLEESLGLHSYTLGLNQFSDLTEDELMHLTSPIMIPEDFEMIPVDINDTRAFAPPASVDWRTAGYVTSVKDQGTKCGSCWAFAVAGALEGLLAKTKGKNSLVDLSPQNLMDCATDPKYRCYGCNGGTKGGAFQYVIDSKGINSEKSYPYEAKDGPCRFKPKEPAITITSYKNVKQNDENELMNAVATYGPVSVTIDFTNLQHYKSGVYDGTCSQTVTHSVLVVGYGTDTQSKKDYWLIKNSHGDTWGENGYFRLARNKNNLCGIATFASYPV